MTTTLDITQEQSGLLDDYYTPQEVATLLKFRTTRPVYKAIESGELTTHRLAGRLYRVSRADLAAWLDRNRLERDLPAPAKTERRGAMSAAAVLEEAA